MTREEILNIYNGSQQQSMSREEILNIYNGSSQNAGVTANVTPVSSEVVAKQNSMKKTAQEVSLMDNQSKRAYAKKNFQAYLQKNSKGTTFGDFQLGAAQNEESGKKVFSDPVPRLSSVGGNISTGEADKKRGVSDGQGEEKDHGIYTSLTPLDNAIVSQREIMSSMTPQEAHTFMNAMSNMDEQRKVEGKILKLEDKFANSNNVVSQMINSARLSKQQDKLYNITRENNETILSDNASQEEIDQAIDKWLTPGYKLTDREKEQARQIYNEYLFTDYKNPNVFDVSDEEKAYAEKMDDLSLKTSTMNAVLEGLGDATPGYKIGKMFLTDDTRAELAKEREDMMVQNSGAYAAANVAGSLYNYPLATNALQAMGVGALTDKAGNAVGQAVGKIGKKAAKPVASAVSNILADTSADVVMDTLPSLTEDIRSGLSAGEVAGNAAANLGTNMGLNMLGEGVQNIFQGIHAKRNAAKIAKANQAANEISQLEALGKELNPLEYGKQTATNGNLSLSGVKRINELEELGKALNPLENTGDILNTGKPKYTLTQIVENVSQKADSEIFDPVEKAFKSPDIGLTHTPEQLKQMQEYYNSVDDSIVNFANKVRNKEYVKPIEVATVSNEAAQKIEELTGISAANNKIVLDKSTIEHIDAHHGINGLSDHSMADDETLARIGYVLNNFDDCQLGKGTTGKVRLASGEQAPKVIFSKKVDGTYYVVEAVTDAKTKTNRVVSAYTTTALKKEAYLMPDVSSFPKRYVQDEAELTSFDNSISNSVENVNNFAKETNFSKAGQFSADTDPVSAVSTNARKDLPADTPEMRARSYTNQTIQKTDIPDEIKNEFRQEPRMYEVLKNSETSTKADNILSNSDFNGAYSQFNNLLAQKDPTAIPLGYKLSKQLAETGNTDQAIDIIDRMSEQLTKSGQFSQSAAITMLQNDPMASMRYMERQIDKMNNVGRQKYSNWKDFNLTDEEVQAFANIDSGDKEAIQQLYGQITDRLAKSYPSTKWEKVVEASKTAMMLNPRTHVRNLAANAVMLPVRSLSDRVSALGQNAVHLFNPDFKVTQSLTGGGSAQKKIANQIFDDQIKPLLADANKWNDVAKNAPMNRQVFNDSIVGKTGKKATIGSLNLANTLTGGKLSNLVDRVDKSMTNSIMENLRKLDYWLLGEVEDNPFVKKNFSNRLASYMQAQGIKTIDDVPNEAVQIAYQEALKATFKDDNMLTKMFSNIKRDTGKFGEVMLPFTQTPANIAMRGIDYSPVGIVNAIKQAKNGVEASQVIDTIAKSATGTAGIALGYKLAEQGIIQGALSSDADKQQFEKQQGKVAFSIKIGNKYFSFDWAQPAAIPIIIGSTIRDAVNGSDKEASTIFNTAFQGAAAATNAWADLSPLSSLQDIFGGSGYSNEGIAENVMNEVIEFPQRLIPALSGAVARTADPTMRQTYSKSNVLQTQIDTAKSKIPFLSETLPASYDTWGNERKRQDSTGSAAFANFLNPGTLGYNASTPIDGEIERLFDATQDNAVFPNKAEWSVKDGDGNKVALSNEQYSEYQKNMGQASYEIADALISSDFYEGLNDADKTKYLSDIYSVAKAKAKSDLFGSSVSDSLQKQIAIYEEEGAEGLVKEFQTKYEITSRGLSVSDKTREIYENMGAEGLATYAEIKEAFKGSKISGANLIPVLDGYGISGTQKGEYISQFVPKLDDNAQTLVDGGDYEGVYQYYEIKNKADADGNGSLSKKELIPYLDGTGMSQADKRYWFGMLSTAENPY